MNIQDLIQKYVTGQKLTEKEQLFLNEALHSSKETRTELIQQSMMNSFLSDIRWFW